MLVLTVTLVRPGLRGISILLRSQLPTCPRPRYRCPATHPDRIAVSSQRELTRPSAPGRVAPCRPSARSRPASRSSRSPQRTSRAVAFYRDGLGWETDGVIGLDLQHGAVPFIPQAGRQQLPVWPPTSQADDSGLAAHPANPTELSLGCNLRSTAEVDAAYATAITAGATPTKPPGPTFWGGYAAYVQDPDGHLWELVFNPDLQPPD